ncbi:MAG: hypothetical protein ABI859_10340 [Pseudomonadota bacterium]
MDKSFSIVQPFGDARDDFRNGFIAGVTQGRGQLHPTEEQVLDAIRELRKFREGSMILPQRLGRAARYSEIHAHAFAVTRE